MKYLLVCIALVALCQSQKPNPPIWPVRFSQDFVETYASSSFYVVGKLYYDQSKNVSMLYRSNGKYESICGSVLSADTACVQLVNKGKRYVIHPDAKQCCVCCVAEKGCGILRRDWLKDAKFVGVQDLYGQLFNRFTIPDGDALDDYWATTDQKTIPRKMNEVGSRFKDFIMDTYSEGPIEDSVFAIPSYCTDKFCPESSKCTLFRQTKTQLKSE